MDLTTTIGYVLSLIGAVVLFLFGMKIMSEAVQKVAGRKLRHFLRTLTYNKGRAILTGLLITGIIQSSSAFTVMTVGLVNAGLVSLSQSVGLIMGANMGTTVTAWLVTFFGFSINMQSVLLPLLALSFPLLFSRKPVVRYSGEIVFGFVILFLGLNFLKELMPDLSQNSSIMELLKSEGTKGSLLFFVGLGILITAVFQSSSAMFTFTMVMGINGFISFDVAAAMILGENIGTTATVNFTAIIANREGKRAAFFHFLFNLIGVAWALLLFHPFVRFVHLLTDGIAPHAQTNPDFYLSLGLSVFHTLFNLTNTLLLIGFTPYLIRFIEKLIPDRQKNNNLSTLTYLPNSILSVSELSLVQARQALRSNSENVLEMFNTVSTLLMEKKEDSFQELFIKLKSSENLIDDNERKLYAFLSKITEGELSHTSTRLVRGFVVSINNIETIGDLCYKMGKLIQEKNKHNAWFIQKQREELFDLFRLVEKALRLMIKNITADVQGINENAVVKTEQKINKKRDTMIRDFHTYQIKNDLRYDSGQYYLKFIELCEKIGDHTLNVSEAIAGHKFF